MLDSDEVAAPGRRRWQEKCRQLPTRSRPREQAALVAGCYTDIRHLARPSSFEFEPATIPFNPDFNRKSLRGNVVLRWEYVRGSTLFLVWNMSTIDETRPGVFAPLEDLGSVFGAAGTHVFMVKLNYWLGL